jgi:hypothetical protein
MLKADGFDEAIIGVGRRCGQPTIVVYDANKCREILQKQLKSDVVEDEIVADLAADEYFEFNVVGAWMGEDTPIFVEPLNGIEELNEWVENNE